MHVFPGGANASLVCNLSLESIAKTFKEHPKAPTPRRRVSAQFDISLRMVLHKSNQKHSLSYHQGLAYLNDVEASGQTYPPLNHWTNRTAAFPAFQLTSEATANCLQQSEASSRNDAKELQNAKSRCLKTTLHFLCTQNLAQALSSWFHWHFLLKLVQLSCCWSHGQILRQGSRDITKQNRSEKKSVSMGTTVRSKQSERCERTAERKSGCLKTTLGFLCTQNFVQTLSSWFHSHFLLTLVQLSSYSTSESNITRQNCSEKKWVSMRTTVRSQQSEPCARTAEREVWLLENNLALFVHSKPCASFVLLISLTLFTQTRTTLMLLKSWTNSSTRESGHHQTKPLWKEIGLNGDNSPKQAVGTMWKNCRTEVWLLENNLGLFVHSKLCANFVLLVSFTLFTHTRTTLKLFDKWVEHHQTKLLWKEMGVNEDNSPKQAVGTMRKNCGTRSLAAWKQPCTFCALKTLRKLCPPDFIDTFYSHSYNSHDAEVMDKFFDKGVGTSPNKTALKRNRSPWGQQSEASSRNDVKELLNGSLAAWKQPWAFCALKTLCKLCPPGFIHNFYSHSYNSQAIRQVSRTSPDKTAPKRNGCHEDNSPKQAVGTMRKNCRTRSLAVWKQPCTFLCTQNLAQTLSSGFHSHFLLKLVQLSWCWSHGQILRQGSRDITSQNCSEKKWVSWGQQSEASSRNHAKELQNAKSGCLKTTLHFFVYSKPCANFVVWISFTLFTQTRTTLKLLKSWTNSSTSESNITRQNCSEKKWVSWGQQSEASSRNHAKGLRNAKSRCLKTTLHFLCTQNLAQTLCSKFHSHSLLTLVQLSSYSTSESNTTRQNCSERKWVSMRNLDALHSFPCPRSLRQFPR